MNGTGAKVSGGGFTGLLIFVWNALLPYLIGQFSAHAAETWPRIDEGTALLLLLAGVSIGDHFLAYDSPRNSPTSTVKTETTVGVSDPATGGAQAPAAAITTTIGPTVGTEGASPLAPAVALPAAA